MHRDINPNNLAVTSLNDPKGLIIDLDSATTEMFSTDHMRGTLAYLAPEIIQVKENKLGSYDKKVDVWALGLSAFAIHIGHPIRWAYVDAGGVQVSKVVNPPSYEAYQRRIHQSQGLTQDVSAAEFFRLIIRMTQYSADDRDTVSKVLDFVSTPKEGLKGNIRLKVTPKRLREE